MPVNAQSNGLHSVIGDVGAGRDGRQSISMHCWNAARQASAAAHLCRHDEVPVGVSYWVRLPACRRGTAGRAADQQPGE